MDVEIAKREGSRYSKADFEVIRKEIINLSSRPEGVRPEDLLERAREENSPLHKFFEWDDAAAAEKYRLEQARKLIYTVTIRIIEDGHDPIRGNYAVRVVDINTGGSTYRPIQDVMNDPLQRGLVLQRALAEFLAWQTRYEHLTELAEIFRVGNVLRKKIQATAKRVTTVVRRARG